MSDKLKFVASVMVGIVLLGLVLAGLMVGTTPTEVDAWLLATPQMSNFGGNDWVMAPYMTNHVLTGTTKSCGSGLQTAAYVLADIQWITTEDDAGGDMNVLTCTMEFSNDNTNWCTGVYTVTTVSTDTTGCGVFTLFGRYSRICCIAAEGGEPITVTERAKLYN